MTTRVALFVVGVASTSLLSLTFVPLLNPTTYERSPVKGELVYQEEGVHEVSVPPVVDTRPVVRHVPLPEPAKVIYMTACVAGTKTFRDELVALIERTEINAVVIDIKDYSGTLSFPPKDSDLAPAWAESRCGAPDMGAFIASLHEKDIFVIGRISVFQDPLRTRMHPELAVKRASDGGVWKDHKGLSFIDVSARPHWDYIIKIAEEAYALGFDELNFDYVRFPSDGNMADISFPHTGTTTKPEALEQFFAYLKTALTDPRRFETINHEHTGRATNTPYLSVDIFGMTTTNTDDLSIGQVLERALPYFDFVAPMVYPSHYPPSFMGLGDPNKYPYKVIHYSMGEAVRRAQATTTPVLGLTHTRIGTTTPALYKKTSYSPSRLRTWISRF